MEAPPPSSSADLHYNHEDELAMASSVVDRMPPGFRFHPTDSEIIDHYLLRKVIDPRFRALAVAEVDLNKSEPWDLPQKAKIGEDEWWFFFEKETKYPTGMRTNRATPSGYWKATGKDKGIYRDKKRLLVGMKKTLVFYKGRAPKGEKTNWVIHEYRLHGDYSAYNLSSDAKEKWVVCKVTHKKSKQVGTGVELARIDSFVDRYLLDSPTPLTDYSKSKPSSTFAAHQYFNSSTLMWNNYTSQELQHLLFANQYSATQMDEDGPTPLTITNTLLPIKGAAHNPNPNSRIVAPYICIGGNESDRMCKLEDTEVVVEGLGFNPNIVSDLDYLWSYATEY